MLDAWLATPAQVVFYCLVVGYMSVIQAPYQHLYRTSPVQDVTKLQSRGTLHSQATLANVQGSLEETIVAMGCRRRRQAPPNWADDAARFTITDAVTDAVRAPPLLLPGVLVTEGRWIGVGLRVRLKNQPDLRTILTRSHLLHLHRGSTAVRCCLMVGILETPLQFFCIALRKVAIHSSTRCFLALRECH